jgi:pyridoxal phosphate enzyme (YggS family)
VRLLAVSKTKPAADVRAAVAAGQRAFGENYVQEGVDKIAALGSAGLEWHFIGPLQSNKTRPVAETFDWVHGIERLKIAERLSAQRKPDLPPLNVCIQVNVSGEASKSGVAPGELPALAQAVAALPQLRLRGLMCIPEPSDDENLVRSRFATLRRLRDALVTDGMTLDTLSMGMSHDLEAAIAEGATIVRVGTAIFGERQLPPHQDGTAQH